MEQPVIKRVRSFNRTVTEGIGVLDDHFLGRGRPLGESRILWEIGNDGTEVRALRFRLGLDSGYISRVLRSLEREGLVRVRAGRGDGRVRQALLTARGRAERTVLDRRSDKLAQRIVAPLSEPQRAALAAAMEKVEQLLQASMVRFAIEDPNTADARWCFKRYFTELDARFDAGFDPGLSIPAAAHELTPPSGVLIVARLRGRPVGCGALKFHGKAPAEVKRMWIAATTRGLGLGARLLAELERHAREAGVRVVRLETNRALREAIALYRRSGYVEVDRFTMKRTRTTGSKSACLPSARTSRPRTDERRRQKDRVLSTKLLGNPLLERLEANLFGGRNPVLDDHVEETANDADEKRGARGIVRRQVRLNPERRHRLESGILENPHEPGADLRRSPCGPEGPHDPVERIAGQTTERRGSRAADVEVEATNKPPLRKFSCGAERRRPGPLGGKNGATHNRVERSSADRRDVALDKRDARLAHRFDADVRRRGPATRDRGRRPIREGQRAGPQGEPRDQGRCPDRARASRGRGPQPGAAAASVPR
jgi:DNA-binding MarR family transcriptional regulator/GNAT superfamily N-acetyltransferase